VQKASVEAIVSALNQHQVRYIVGGLIVMKSLANRPRDQQDIDELRKLPRRS
jgi:hypothetical protein